MDPESRNVYDEEHKVFRYPNEILSLCAYPDIEKSVNLEEDVHRAAHFYIDQCDGKSVGSYTEMVGMPSLQEDIGNYISERDGIKIENTDEILVESQQEDLLNLILPVFPGYNKDQSHGMMVPLPFSPTLPMVIKNCGFEVVPYYPIEYETHWTITKEILIEAFNRYSCKIQCIFVENPGYPMGNLYKRNDLETVFKFAKDYGLVIIAIENLQMDIYVKEETFLSMRKVLLELGPDYSEIQLISMFTPNRSPQGQPGYTVTFLDSIGMDNILLELGNIIFNTATTLSQVYLSLFLKPVQFRNDNSFKRFDDEREELKSTLSRLLKMTIDFVSKLDYVSCSKAKAGNTVFPQLMFPKEWLSKTDKADVTDFERLYCEKLMEETGLHITPGVYFGQKPGSSHFKLNIPIDEGELLKQLEKLKVFHDNFCKSMK